MKRISVELVPRSEETLREELQLLKNIIPDIDLINVPDLLRCDIRSWQGAALAAEYFPAAMPHIRAIDIDIAQPLPMPGRTCSITNWTRWETTCTFSSSTTMPWMMPAPVRRFLWLQAGNWQRKAFRSWPVSCRCQSSPFNADREGSEIL